MPAREGTCHRDEILQSADNCLSAACKGGKRHFKTGQWLSKSLLSKHLSSSLPGPNPSVQSGILLPHYGPVSQLSIIAIAGTKIPGIEIREGGFVWAHTLREFSLRSEGHVLGQNIVAMETWWRVFFNS